MVGASPMLVVGSVLVVGLRPDMFVAMVTAGADAVRHVFSPALVVDHAVAQRPEERFGERTGHQEGEQQVDPPATTHERTFG
jgi:hypothetical protein